MTLTRFKKWKVKGIVFGIVAKRMIIIGLSKNVVSHVVCYVRGSYTETRDCPLSRFKEESLCPPKCI